MKCRILAESEDGYWRIGAVSGALWWVTATILPNQPWVLVRALTPEEITHHAAQCDTLKVFLPAPVGQYARGETPQNLSEEEKSAIARNQVGYDDDE